MYKDVAAAYLMFNIFVYHCLFSCREKDTDIEFAQDAIDEYKVRTCVFYQYDIM